MRKRSKVARFWFTPLGQRWEDELREYLIECTAGTPPPDMQARMWATARKAARLRGTTPTRLIVTLMKELAKEGR